MSLTSQQLTDEVQNLVDTSGAVYIDEAVSILSWGGVEALRERCARFALDHKTPPLKLFVYQLALACATYPSVRFTKSQSDALVETSPTTTEN